MTFAEKSGFDWKVKSGGIEKKVETEDGRRIGNRKSLDIHSYIKNRTRRVRTEGNKQIGTLEQKLPRRSLWNKKTVHMFNW